MNLQLLTEFVELSKCLNFSKAAENLYLTQPALSRHISDLEKQLGVPLLVRNTRTVQLTETGRIFAEGCTQILNKFDEMSSRIAYATNGMIGVLSVGFISYTISNFLPYFITYFTKQHSQIRIEFDSTELSNLVSKLGKDELDIAFTLGSFIPDSTLYNVIPICRNHICAILPVEHPLANKKKLYLKDLSREPLIAISQSVNPWSSVYYESLFHSNFSEYRLAHEVSNVDTALFYVISNLGIFIMPEPQNNIIDENILIKKIICDENCDISINLVFKKNNNNPLINIFINSFYEYFTSPENRHLLPDFNEITYLPMPSNLK